MFRKIDAYRNYKKNGIIIRPASLDEEYEVGKWSSLYPWIKVGYENKSYQKKHSDITYIMISNEEIIGYFMAHTVINMGNDSNLPLYGSELILHDFAVDIKAYGKHSRILIDYMIDYARYNGCCAVTFVKAEENNRFNEFISRHYRVEEIDNKIYLLIENPRISNGRRHLTLYEGDKVSLEDLYFLYDLKFDILKTLCKLRLNGNEEIIIDRLSGIIYFPDSIKLIKDKVTLNDITKTLIYITLSMYDMGDVKPVNIYYDSVCPNYYEADTDGLLYVAKGLHEIRRDSEYTDSLIKRGYDRVVPNSLKYNMNERSFSDSRVVYRLVK